MKETEQFPGMSIWEHGQDVHKWFLKLKYPSWAKSLTDKLPSMDILKLYHIYHDCGKPFCKIIDNEGKQHFPGHAELSAKLWKEASDNSEESQLIGRLIRMDMDAHTLKGVEAINEFLSRSEAPALILTSYAEVWSNTNHLGLIGSDSFKIKLKRIEKLGKRYALLAQRQEQESLKLKIGVQVS